MDCKPGQRPAGQRHGGLAAGQVHHPHVAPIDTACRPVPSALAQASLAAKRLA